MNLRWDFFVNAYDTHRYLPAAGLDGRENRHIAYVREFAGVVSVLQDKTNAVIESYKDVNRIVEELATCPHTAEAFTEHLDKIQQAVGPSLWSLVRYLMSHRSIVTTSRAMPTSKTGSLSSTSEYRGFFCSG